MSSILAPVSAAAFRNDNLDWYGAIELDRETGEPVWRFDATDSSFETARIYEDERVLRHTGFRPASVDRLDDGRTLIADWSRGVIVDEDGTIRNTFTHPLMNDVHELQRAPNGWYLVASTGMDTLLVLDEDFEELWRWHMWEHVEASTRPDDYYPDQLWYHDARDLALNPDDRYHLNYATFVDGTISGSGTATILCSALNYGIFTVSMETDEITNQFRGLTECHNPYQLGDTYVVAESGANRVVIVDWDGRHDTLFDERLDFVKDADPVGDGEWLITDTKHDRVLLWNEDADVPSATFELGEDANPYEADYLEEPRSLG